MFELGKDAEIEHQNIADLCSKFNLNKVFLIGNHFNNISTSDSKIIKFQTLESFEENFIPFKNSTILIKGSRGMALERILKLLK